MSESAPKDYLILTVRSHYMQTLNKELLGALRPLQLQDEIRLGSKNRDGGYIVPRRVIENSQLLISLGYGHNYDFERDFLNFSPDKRVELYESSISFRTELSRVLHNFSGKLLGKRAFPIYSLKTLFKFIKVRITPRLKYHYKEVKKFQNSKRQIAFTSVIDQVPNQNSALLKMDIEGAEYEILKNVNVFSAFNGLVVEFHDIQTRSDEFHEIIESIKKYFLITHFHLNNFVNLNAGIPDAIEITFLHRRLLDKSEVDSFKTSLPIDLDRPCNPNSVDLQIKYHSD